MKATAVDLSRRRLRTMTRSGHGHVRIDRASVRRVPMCSGAVEGLEGQMKMCDPKFKLQTRTRDTTPTHNDNSPENRSTRFPTDT